MGEQELRESGRLARDLVLPGCDWVHRRVQRLSYLGPDLMVSGLSIDFTVPEPPLGSHVPISVLPKWPPLYDFDFHAADGSPLPLLTSLQNGIIDESLLFALVEEVSPASMQHPSFAAAVRSLTRGPETHLGEAFGAFRDGLEGDLDDSRVERLLDIAAMLADATFLWYPLADAKPGERLLCKLSYLIPGEKIESLPRRIGRSLSWVHPAEYIPLWHSGADANFHAELEAPPVMRIRAVEANFYWFTEDDPASETELATEEAQDAGLRPDQYVDVEGSLAHVYVAGRRPLGADLLTTLAPTRAAVLPMFFATIVIGLLASVFYLWRDQMIDPADRDAVVAVLILIPALIGYVVIRPADHPSLRSRILGVQLLSLAASVIPLCMAILLLRYADDPTCLNRVWLAAVIFAWVIAAMMLVSVLRAGGEE